MQYYDSDFYDLDISKQIKIMLCIGDLDDNLKSLESYGMFLRGFNNKTFVVEDEPDDELETVITVQLVVGSDLEPVWSLFSERAQEQNISRNLTWKDRVRLAPARIGVLSHYNLCWRQGSVLNKLTEEKADSAAALAYAARQARETFGDDAEEQLRETLKVVTETARELGVDVGAKVRALLDAHAVSFTDGAISLHNEEGIPLRGLGVGSTRLLIAGLQRKASEKSSLLLVDEVEYGLEPHRIIRFLGSLGAKEKQSPFQVFMTTHSPVVLRELSGSQLNVLRRGENNHDIHNVGRTKLAQGTIRSYPDAYLATSVIVCEGASEVGFVRGMDLYEQSIGKSSIFACGTALIDAGGVDKIVNRALAFQHLGYRVSILRDDDANPDPIKEQAFIKSGGKLFRWRRTRKIEDEIFLSMPDVAVAMLVEKAASIHPLSIINDQIKSASSNALNRDMVPASDNPKPISEADRLFLAKASSGKTMAWFKTVSAMEELCPEIIGPNMQDADNGFRLRVERLLRWARNA